jgi:translation initiation factor IF-3
LAKPRKRFSRRPEKPQFRTNREIRIPKIRLVGENLNDISEVAGKTIESGIYYTNDALKWADAMDLDLVEISPKADPPVCRIIDYKKFLYNKKKKERELKAKTSKTVIKEIRFGPNTDDHDFEFKLRHAQKFLSDGAKVKAYVHFRGRTIVFKERGELLLLKFLKELEEFGAAEALPKMEGRRMTVIVSPKKKKKS